MGNTSKEDGRIQGGEVSDYSSRRIVVRDRPRAAQQTYFMCPLGNAATISLFSLPVVTEISEDVK